MPVGDIVQRLLLAASVGPEAVAELVEEIRAEAKTEAFWEFYQSLNVAIARELERAVEGR